MENCGEFVLKPIYNKYRFEKLKNQNGLMSIRLDRKYRLTFFEGSHQQKEFIEIVSVEIQDVTNHYGD